MLRFAEPILHVDMDAFFVEVERLRNPRLGGRPVIVGGLGHRGVVASASYEARRFGVRSAMPMVEARRRCPQGEFVPPDHRRYAEVSAEVVTLLESFTPYVEPLSVDEAFLDVGGLRRHHESPEAVAIAIRERIRSELALPASVGIAGAKFIAKMASEDAKPDGWLKIPAGTELDYLHPLPVRRLWGVGEATHASLEGLGVTTIGDLAALDQKTLERRLGAAMGAHLGALARGIDLRAVTVERETKSVSVEETYERDLTSDAAVQRELVALCDRLASRLRTTGHRGHTVTLKVRFADFTTLTRSATVSTPAGDTGDVRPLVRQLWRRVGRDGRGVRLLGVGVSGLVARDQPLQLALDASGRGAAAAVDAIRDRFGDGAVVPARLAGPPEPPPVSAEDHRRSQGR
jgi:DNA polymerase IV